VAIARHPGVILDDRGLLTNEPIEEGALAHIGPPDDDDAFAGVSIRHFVHATEASTHHRFGSGCRNTVPTAP
jgi:hypothetical protein